MLTIAKCYPRVTYLWVIFSIFAEVFQKMFRKMTAYQSPFQFGTLATEENFIDRVEDRAMLKQMLASHINVMLISPRRWGKSSLVKKAMGESVISTHLALALRQSSIAPLPAKSSLAPRQRWNVG